MLFLFEQLSSIGKTNLDTALKFGSAGAELMERLVKAQTDAATEMLDSNNEQMQPLWSKPGSAASVAYWQSAY